MDRKENQFKNSKYSKQYKKAYEQHQEKTSTISRPCDEKGKARAFVDNRKDRRKKKQRSSRLQIQDGIAAWLGRSTADMFVDARYRKKWKVMIAYACNRHGNWWWWWSILHGTRLSKWCPPYAHLATVIATRYTTSSANCAHQNELSVGWWTWKEVHIGWK